MHRIEAERQCILLCVTGSRMYHLHTESSDYDYRGILLRPTSDYLSFDSFEQKDKGWDTEEGLDITPFSSLSKDTVLYDIRKYLTLAQKGNPNILELLFADEYLYLTPVGKSLIEQRHLFLSQACKKSYVGYAYSQMHRIQTRRRWLLNPVINRPEPSDFGFNDTYKITSKEELFAFCEFLFDCVKRKLIFFEPVESFHRLLFEDLDFKALFKTELFEEEAVSKVSQITGTPVNYIHQLQNSKRYYQAIRDYENYQAWLKNRNPERAEMEAKTGYDVKHATHCLRLLYQAFYIFTEQTLITNVNHFPKGESDYIRLVKAGQLKYEDLLQKTEDLFNLIKNMNIKTFRPPLSNIELSEIFKRLLLLNES